MKKLNWFFIFCVILSLVSCETQKSIDQPPNVILIISDQWSTKVSDGSGNYDNGILTPGIDLLAKQGISFKQAYSTYPLCTPARASLFTGLYSHHNDVGFNLKKDSILARAQFTPTLGKSFKEAGYNVAYFGKEHAGGYGYASATEFGSMTHSNGGMLISHALLKEINNLDDDLLFENEELTVPRGPEWLKDYLNKPDIYFVSKGDTLWSIAKK